MAFQLKAQITFRFNKVVAFKKKENEIVWVENLYIYKIQMKVVLYYFNGN